MLWVRVRVAIRVKAQGYRNCLRTKEEIALHPYIKRIFCDEYSKVSSVTYFSQGL